MFDIQWIRDHPEAFDRAMQRRDIGPLAVKILDIDERRRQVVAQMNDAQEQRNSRSKDIGAAKREGDDARAQSLMDQVTEIKARVQDLEEQNREITEELNTELASYPNILLDDVPDGADEDENIQKSIQGHKPSFDFQPKEHFDLGEALGMMDFDIAGKISGSRFVVLKGQLATLERALAQFMLNMHVNEHGCEEVSPPYLVRSSSLFGTSQLPKFTEDLFVTTEDDKWLIPTSEVPLTNLVREQQINEADLPLRFTTLTPCFRSEAGSAGRDTRGMLRQHQFQKVEMVSITTPETSLEEQERMLGCAENVLKALGLHYRVVTLCSGDTGFAAQRTFDIEVWLPGQNAYREISSVSVCGDFQARRMHARLRRAGQKELDYVHTLNGSGVAVGRALIAIMENYQRADGSIEIPECLRHFMGGLECIEPEQAS